MLQLKSQLPSDPLEVSLDLPRTGQSCLNMRQNILRSNMLQKIRTRDKARWLVTRSAEKQRFACFVQAIGELLECVDASCVERCHIPKAQDHYVSKRLQTPGRLCKLLGCPEEKRPMDAENRYVGGNVLVLKNVRLSVCQVFLRDRRNSRRLRDTVDIEEWRQRHPDSHRYRQIGEDGQGKRCEPNGNIGLRQAKDRSYLPPLPHVVGHHEQDR